jgi:hypothetical protein
MIQALGHIIHDHIEYFGNEIFDAGDCEKILVERGIALYVENATEAILVPNKTIKRHYKKRKNK